MDNRTNNERRIFALSEKNDLAENQNTDGKKASLLEVLIIMMLLLEDVSINITYLLMMNLKQVIGEMTLLQENNAGILASMTLPMLKLAKSLN